ncbi:hypothetical protein [Pseudonocardia cypriaca]|uniref:Secreted protein n=1 Tax=Pseudonocardia cypriaca TaxID=882449 RepID=A0A543GGS6_9PSEU|nr:hypothetical protein [Pseudonocardia cypriaca]TQM45278.1 hypothetical protein FB388_2676 [Pseudonocardia cypriaca]
MSLDLENATRAPASGTTRSGLRQRFRVLAAGPSTPDRLRRLGAVLVLGCVLAGVFSLVDGSARTEAVREGGTRIAAVHADAAELYRSLADADAMATSGFVSGGQEPAEIRARYDRDIADTTARLVHAAGLLPADDPAAPALATISEQLPVYSGLVESARTYNRLGYPLGQSYLDSASRLMSTQILPAADELRSLQARALADAYGRAGSPPIAVLLIGLAALAALVDAAVREGRRTQRILSVGLTVAGAAIVVALLWWVVATSVASGHLADAGRHSGVADTLDDARAAVLQARSNESLVLVARSGGAADSGFTAAIESVLGTPTEGNGLLDIATDAAAPDTDERIAAVRLATEQWMTAHRRLRELDDGGIYRDAVASATGADPGGSGAAFDRLGAVLGDAIDAERAAFREQADAAAAALNGLAAGPAVLAVLAAAAATAGIARRVEEYR